MIKSKLYSALISTLIGLLAGPLFFIIAVIMDQVGIEFDIWLPTVISLVIIFVIFFFIIKKTDNKTFIIAIIFLVLSSTYSLCFTYDVLLLGPEPEQLTYMHLLAKIRDEKGRIDPNWTKSEWNFYKPRCYITFCAERYRNTSLEVAVFYYGHYGKSAYNPHSVLKYLFTKLFCGITDSKTAYEGYKRLLFKSGFLITSRNNYFIAENKSIIIYCYFENKFITVIKANKNEKYLLNKIKI